MKDPVIEYLKSLEFRDKAYQIRVSKRNALYRVKIVTSKGGLQAGYIDFTIERGRMYIAWGQTNVGHERKGIGLFLRAVATKAGSIAKANHGNQIGIFTNARSEQLGTPASTRVLQQIPGWVSNAGHRSKFNYKTANITKVNAIIRKFAVIKRNGGGCCSRPKVNENENEQLNRVLTRYVSRPVNNGRRSVTNNFLGNNNRMYKLVTEINNPNFRARYTANQLRSLIQFINTSARFYLNHIKGLQQLHPNEVKRYSHPYFRTIPGFNKYYNALI